MRTDGKWPLIAGLITFLVFFANVTFGALGNKPILGDVGEMLLLFLSVLLFVIGLLIREKATLRRSSD